MFRITVSKNGPFIIEGKYDFFEETIVQRAVLDREKSKTFKQKEPLYLCRCGKSNAKPFCDGNHSEVNFDGQTTASKEDYVERSDLITGPAMSLLDDQRCAFARFCHRQHGSVWELTREPKSLEHVEEAIEGATACPAGRLTAIVEDSLIEDVYADEITIVQDPLKETSAGIFVRGDFELVDENNELFEKRNRVSLCRCGESKIKPFCDATHTKVGFNDNV